MTIKASVFKMSEFVLFYCKLFNVNFFEDFDLLNSKFKWVGSFLVSYKIFKGNIKYL